jgi:hypothetical protein
MLLMAGRPHAAPVGYELMVSAWPEPPDIMSVDPSTGARCGLQGTFAIVEFIETRPLFSKHVVGSKQLSLSQKEEQGSNAPLPLPASMESAGLPTQLIADLTRIEVVGRVRLLRHT